MREIFTFILSLLGIIGLIFLTYYASRWLNKKVSFSGSRSIHILERIMLGQDKSLIVVKTGTKYMLLGVTAHHIEKIADLTPEDLTEVLLPPDMPSNGSFLQNLKKATAEHSFVKPFLPKEKQEEHTDDA